MKLMPQTRYRYQTTRQVLLFTSLSQRIHTFTTHSYPTEQHYSLPKPTPSYSILTQPSTKPSPSPSQSRIPYHQT